MPHFDNAPYMISDAVPQAHFMHSNTGEIPPNAGYPHRAMGDASQLPEQYFPMGVSVPTEHPPRVPPLQGYQVYQDNSSEHQKLVYTALSAEAHPLPTMRGNSLQQQHDGYVPVGSPMHNEPLAAHWSASNSQPSTPATTSRPPSATGSRLQNGSRPSLYAAQGFGTSPNDWSTGVSAHADAFLPGSMQPDLPTESVSPPRMIRQDSAKPTVEYNESQWQGDLAAASSDLASWDSGFFADAWANDENYTPS